MTEILVGTDIDKVQLQPQISRELSETKPEATSGSIQDHLRRRLAQGTLSISEIDDLLQSHDMAMQKYMDY